MATCVVQDIMDEATCFFPYAQGAQGRALELALLCRILKAYDPMADCDIDTLMAEAKCFFGVAKGAEGMALMLQLLCNIEDAIGGGGGGGGPGGGCLPGIWRASPSNPEPPPPHPACDGQYLRFYDFSPSLYWSTALNKWL